MTPRSNIIERYRSPRLRGLLKRDMKTDPLPLVPRKALTALAARSIKVSTFYVVLVAIPAKPEKDDCGDYGNA